MKKFNLFAMSLMALVMACFTACESNNPENVDYATEIIGTWVHETDDIFDRFDIQADGTYTRNVINWNYEVLDTNSVWEDKGKWTISSNKLSFVSSKGKGNFQPTIKMLVPDGMVMLSDKSNSTTVYIHVETALSAGLAGTWTCVEGGYADAMVIAADGSFVATGMTGNKYWEGAKGSISRYNDTYTYYFQDNDGDYTFGNCEIIPGEMLSCVDFSGNRHVYKYCKKDFSQDIIGMWVCNDASADESNDMTILSYSEDGTLTYTGFSPMQDNFVLKSKINYNVIGDLMIYNFESNGVKGHNMSRIVISPNATVLGDIMTTFVYREGREEPTQTSLIRVKEELDLLNSNMDIALFT